MSLLGSRYFVLTLLVVCMFSGCISSGQTLLGGNFQSYQTVQSVQAELSRRGLSAGWKEDSQGTDPKDRRPPYKFTYLSGPFKLDGVDGYLKFTFYNDRLMETQFSTEKGNDYMTELRRHSSNVPQRAAQEVVTDRRTRLRYDSVPDGRLVFTWYDPKLEKEWRDWVASHS
jgi:hypothetical protein